MGTTGASVTRGPDRIPNRGGGERIAAVFRAGLDFPERHLLLIPIPVLPCNREMPGNI
jgi:hypothetical protein